jgi:flagellar hook protein FlgE
LYSGLAIAGPVVVTAGATVGMPNTNGFGTIEPGALEISNVDISREFTNMITTQRAFQANARIITASDDMLQETMRIIR